MSACYGLLLSILSCFSGFNYTFISTIYIIINQVCILTFSCLFIVGYEVKLNMQFLFCPNGLKSQYVTHKLSIYCRFTNQINLISHVNTENMNAQ